MKLVPIRQPNGSVVNLITDLLRQAQAGELISLIYSAEIPGGQVQTGYTAHEDLYGAIGQLERMKHLLLRVIDHTAQDLNTEDTEK